MPFVHRFTYVDVGAEGRVSDGGVFRSCSLSQALERNQLGLPPAKAPRGWDNPLPYVILGDEAFPLKRNVMRPYPARQLNREKRVSYDIIIILLLKLKFWIKYGRNLLLYILNINAYVGLLYEHILLLFDYEGYFFLFILVDT